MTIGVSSVGGGADQLVRFLAKQAKLDPDRDMTISALGSGEAMLAALSRGRIDGFVVPPPAGEEAIRKYGAHPMITTGAGEVKALDGFVYIGVIVRESWVQKNQDLAVRFLRAQQRGLEAVHDPRRTEKARDAVKAKYLREDRRGILQRDLGRRQAVLSEDHRAEARDGGAHRQLRERDHARAARQEGDRDRLDQRLCREGARHDEALVWSDKRSRASWRTAPAE